MSQPTTPNNLGPAAGSLHPSGSGHPMPETQPGEAASPKPDPPKPDHSAQPPRHTRNRILAIDGPAGAGKSTIAAHMARRFGLLPIETGAMYRAFALKALASHTALDDAPALTQLSQTTTLTLRPSSSRGAQVLLDGAEVTARLRSPQVTEAASRISVHAPIRAWMVRLQQALGLSAPQGVVMEGRDIGTVVFPQASVKIFLFATPEARTGRRLAQSSPGTNDQDAAAALAALRERDARDSTRLESPLCAAEDAVRIDSTHLTLDQVIEEVATLVSRRWSLPPA